MSVKEELQALAAKMNRHPEGLAGLRGVFRFELHGEESGTHQVTFAGDQVAYSEGSTDDADCTLQLSDKNLVKLIHGELNPTAAFMMGKLKVQGNLGLSLKLQQVLQHYQSIQ